MVITHPIFVSWSCDHINTRCWLLLTRHFVSIWKTKTTQKVLLINLLGCDLFYNLVAAVRDSIALPWYIFHDRNTVSVILHINEFAVGTFYMVYIYFTWHSTGCCMCFLTRNIKFTVKKTQGFYSIWRTTDRKITKDDKVLCLIIGIIIRERMIFNQQGLLYL